jgi:two-component system cell cycle response regulator DivK
MTASSPDAAGADAQGDGLVVLIVDDSDTNRKLARDLLRAAGFRTLEAASGAEGIELAAEHVPDVVLMDLELPDMDGVQAARTLAAGAETEGIPVLALSAHALEGRGAWLVSAGFAGYLKKPLNVRDFPDQVRRYCLTAPR